MKKSHYIRVLASLLLCLAAVAAIMVAGPYEPSNPAEPAPPLKNPPPVVPDAVSLSPAGQGVYSPSPPTDVGEQDTGPPPSEKQLAIQRALDSMTPEQKAAQLFMIRCANADILRVSDELNPGGWILFSANTKDESPQSLATLIQKANDASALPMLIAVDEEGGTVSRIGRYAQYSPSPFLSPQRLFSQGGMDLIKQDAERKSKLLLGLGINLNLAPVCDISTGRNDFIYPRAFGQPAEQTAEYVGAVVAAMKEQNIGAALKHFPGYGDNADTHTGSAIDNRNIEIFLAGDFLPFIAGIEAGAGGVLVSHNVVAAIDDLPASLSPEMHRILREDLGFDGVIITDDLAMRAITDPFGLEDAAVRAVLAGNDLLIASDYRLQIAAVIAAMRDGRIGDSTIDAAVGRILGWKYDLGLIK